MSTFPQNSNYKSREEVVRKAHEYAEDIVAYELAKQSGDPEPFPESRYNKAKKEYLALLQHKPSNLKRGSR